MLLIILHFGGLLQVLRSCYSAIIEAWSAGKLDGRNPLALAKPSTLESTPDEVVPQKGLQLEESSVPESTDGADTQEGAQKEDAPAEGELMTEVAKLLGLNER